MTRTNQSWWIVGVTCCVAACGTKPAPATNSTGQAGTGSGASGAAASVAAGSSGGAATTSSGGPSSSGSGGTDATGASGRAGAAPAGTGGSSGQTATAGASATGQGGSGVAQGGGGAAGSATAGAGGASGVPETGTFPEADVSKDGPYTAQTVNNTGPSNGYTIYRPMDLAPDGVLNPIVSWGNGALTTPDLYPMLPHLATHGFVVIAANSSSITPELDKAGVEWIVQQNETMDSPYYHKLDTNNIAGVGYSLGGLATYGLAGDMRMVTTVIISGANMSDSNRGTVGKLLKPTAYFCTDDDASRGNCDGDYAVITVPAFYGVMKGTEHVDVVFDQATADRLSKAVTSWLRWQQMKDQTQKSTFVGSDCGLCKDAQWAVQQKNGLM